jgi:hypothetical protein
MARDGRISTPSLVVLFVAIVLAATGCAPNEPQLNTSDASRSVADAALATPEPDADLALAALHLAQARDVQLAMPDEVKLRGGGFVGWDVTLDNRSGRPVTVPTDGTYMRWTGRTWERMPCGDVETTDPTTGLCGTWRTNGTILAPGAHRSADDPSVFFGPRMIEPGTYALVVPIWRTSEEYPEGAPTEAVVVVVTLTDS